MYELPGIIEACVIISITVFQKFFLLLQIFMPFRIFISTAAIIYLKLFRPSLHKFVLLT